MKKRIGTIIAAVLSAIMILTAGLSVCASGSSADRSVKMNKTSLELTIGEKDTLTASYTGNAVWSSSDDGVVSVDNKGNVTGISAGEATVTVKTDDGVGECRVSVVESDFDFDRNILLSIFWPPTKDYINDEQYKYMADAEIDWVMGAGDALGAKETQLKMLELCAKYGMGMTVADDRMGSKLLSSSEKKIKELAVEYKNVPGAHGYYLLDEPFNPNVFIDAYRALKSVDPTAYMHLNFLPINAYGSPEIYKSQMNDWLKLCAGAGYPQEYLMYDQYPFPLQKGTINRTLMLNNLEAARQVGLKNNVKTAMYIQSVSQTAAFRSLDREETLFEMNTALAFGIKQLSYFTWFTPKDRSEPFADGIISAEGVPNAKYEFVCELDRMIHNVGKTLVKLDSLEVYESSDTYGTELSLIPEDFFVQVTGRSDLTVAYMRDKVTGRNYCMLVNNFFDRSQTTTLKFAKDTGKLQYVSYEDGEFYPLDTDNGGYRLTLGAGEALIVALGEDFDRSGKTEGQPAPGTNLASDAEIFCTSSVGSEWYMDNLNDKVRFSSPGANGWQSNSKKGLDTVTVQLKDVYDINRIDLYPAGSGASYGAYMPKDFTVSWSADGQSWYTVANVTELQIRQNTPLSLKFDSIKAKYIKIDIKGCVENKAQLCEIEIYNDDGSVGDVELYKDGSEPVERGSSEPVEYTPGQNIAAGKKVTVSSYPESTDYRSWGWAPEFLVDGNEKTGWTSNVKLHMDDEQAVEYTIIDLGDQFDINKINVFKLGCWPVDFTVSVSADSSAYSVISDQTGSTEPESVFTIEPTSAHGRFIMFKATKLRGTAADGYMLQLGEIEVFGEPYVDRDEANGFIKAYVENGGDENSEAVRAVRDALGSDKTTQNGLDKLLKNMLDEVGLSLSAPVKEQKAAEYTVDYGPFDRPADNEAQTNETDKVTDSSGAETLADGSFNSDTDAEPLKDPGKSRKRGVVAAIATAAAAAAAAVAAGIAIKRRKK